MRLYAYRLPYRSQAGRMLVAAPLAALTLAVLVPILVMAVVKATLQMILSGVWIPYRILKDNWYE